MAAPSAQSSRDHSMTVIVSLEVFKESERGLESGASRFERKPRSCSCEGSSSGLDALASLGSSGCDCVSARNAPESESLPNSPLQAGRAPKVQSFADFRRGEAVRQATSVGWRVREDILLQPEYPGAQRRAPIWEKGPPGGPAGARALAAAATWAPEQLEMRDQRGIAAMGQFLNGSTSSGPEAPGDDSVARLGSRVWGPLDTMQRPLDVDPVGSIADRGFQREAASSTFFRKEPRKPKASFAGPEGFGTHCFYAVSFQAQGELGGFNSPVGVITSTGHTT